MASRQSYQQVIVNRLTPPSNEHAAGRGMDNLTLPLYSLHLHQQFSSLGYAKDTILSKNLTSIHSGNSIETYDPKKIPRQQRFSPNVFHSRQLNI
jgi:hypothetical protein